MAESLSSEEDLFLEAAYVADILRRHAAARPTIGRILYDRMRMPYVWLSWTSPSYEKRFSDGRVLRANRRQRLRLLRTSTGIRLDRWALGERQSHGIMAEIRRRKRRADAARSYVRGLREEGKPLFGPHYWKAVELFEAWSETLSHLAGFE